jgi:mannose-6-phosphate isomerase
VTTPHPVVAAPTPDRRESDRRPWGGYLVLDDAADCKVKRITVDAGQRLSYQRHERRSEHWFVVAGTGTVTLDGTDRDLVAGSTVDIPAGTAHRMANPGTVPLVFVEIQHGSYFGEDDITRLADDYGRSSAPT